MNKKDKEKKGKYLKKNYKKITNILQDKSQNLINDTKKMQE